MKISRSSEDTPVQTAPGRQRRVAHTDNLMVVVWDFADGPAKEPDAPHSHPHEQVTYVAEGEVLFFVGEESSRLVPGDMVVVPPDKPHTVQPLTSRLRLIDSFTPL
ncbi:cupin domain-containing protein, partial [bacterium]|nr:cupin domain-containing protein [bacterium]